MRNGNNSTQKTIDEAIRESFPASDAPAWSTPEEYHKRKIRYTALQDKVKIQWERKTDSFDYTAYNREGVLQFNGGTSIEVSNPPQYFGKPEYANPEELLAAAVSFCYMQTFLAVASLQGYSIQHYSDEAVSTLEKSDTGKMSITEIKLNPLIKFEGIQPSEAALLKLQEKAYQNCFLVNSIRSKVDVHIQLAH